MAEDAQIQKHMEGVVKKFARGMKCKALKLEHLVSDIKALGHDPSKGAVEVMCEKYERREPPNSVLADLSRLLKETGRACDEARGPGKHQVFMWTLEAKKSLRMAVDAEEARLSANAALSQAATTQKDTNAK